MHASTTPKLVAAVERRLLAEHAIALITMEGSGFWHQLDNDRYEDITRMHQLFSRINALIPWNPPAELIASERDKEKHSPPVAILKDMMKAKIMREGFAIVSDVELQKEPSKLIQSLIDLRDKYTKIVAKAFGNDRIFVGGLKEVGRAAAMHSCHAHLCFICTHAFFVCCVAGVRKHHQPPRSCSSHSRRPQHDCSIPGGVRG